MKRTAPIFYRIHVTTALVDGVAVLAYPQKETMVLRFIPPVPNQELYNTEGMHPLANRRSVFQRLEAFKAVIVRLLPAGKKLHLTYFQRNDVYRRKEICWITSSCIIAAYWKYTESMKK